MWPLLTSQVILHFIKKMCLYYVSIQIFFFLIKIALCARKKKVKIPESQSFRVQSIRVFLWDIEELTFLIKRLQKESSTKFVSLLFSCGRSPGMTEKTQLKKISVNNNMFIVKCIPGFRIRQIIKKILVPLHRFDIMLSIITESYRYKRCWWIPAFKFWMLRPFQVDWYPKDPDPLVKIWQIRNPDVWFHFIILE